MKASFWLQPAGIDGALQLVDFLKKPIAELTRTKVWLEQVSVDDWTHRSIDVHDLDW